MTASQPTTWAVLGQLAQARRKRHLADDFASDEKRFERFSYSSNSLMLDLSKQRIDQDVLTALLDLAVERDLAGWIDKLFTGAKVNNSEDRPALHTALRAPASEQLVVRNQNIGEDIHNNLNRMDSLVSTIQQRQWRGYSGLPVDTLVNIGVGGSDLGPQMACRALEEFEYSPQTPLSISFVSSMDGSQLSRELSRLNPRTTLFIISSKSFSTVDTLANANTARRWLIEHSACGEELLLKQHFIGISCKPEKMLEWGIPKSNHLAMWDWVGGRYSLWSSIGFVIAARIGMDGFRRMLQGAHRMDRHFRQQPLDQNLPVLMALAEIWNINFLDIHARAILPYDGRLAYLPTYLGQLEMESNGKSVTRSGDPLTYSTCPIIWGDVGPNAQHAFYQLLHQGTPVVMCDFIAESRRPETSDHPDLSDQHQLTLANFLAQSRILALGDSVVPDSADAPTHKRYGGNRPSSTLLLEELNPESFGELIALYEHKVFVQSVIWDINPFDQWGVELGKTVSGDMLKILKSQPSNRELDASTRGLIDAIRANADRIKSGDFSCE